ncbi:MAG: exodeoxyribonuclease VII large subunit [Alphaproteobacteria bacterium]|nr:exodeoxyribonuclease VII large subunit [Alphaproteobacteria bacterium]
MSNIPDSPQLQDPRLRGDVGHNDIIYSVSEVSQALKRMVEDHFGVVKLRGEISGYKLHSSGHAYFTLKDENALIDAVCWRGTLSKMKFRPEDGLEVVATGKLTTYPGRSKYQIVVDNMEPAGAGALMALLEKRRAALEAEGLFAQSRKKKLPAMPRVVGVVTSPTGAVIRDILHRISERFPCHVLVWPVAVQGEGAAEQIAAAIKGFNAMANPPDVIIVARGGGSLEDLWAFNEEIVVRAAAASAIPLISAVGHETDTTLIDYASDRRAPTPTAAAEMAVPVLSDLRLALTQLESRLAAAIKRHLAESENTLVGLLRGLPKPMQLLQFATQRLDDVSERHAGSLNQFLARKEQQLALAVRGLTPGRLLRDMEQQQAKLTDYLERTHRAALRLITQKSDKITSLASMLETMNVQRVLERGFALVRGENGALITSSVEAGKQKKLEIQFADGRIKTTS